VSPRCELPSFGRDAASAVQPLLPGLPNYHRRNNTPRQALPSGLVSGASSQVAFTPTVRSLPMVGVPRSRGCPRCVKRRVKCDESRPACGNCVKYGAECPGYGRDMKFVAGKHAVRQRRPKAESDRQDSRPKTAGPSGAPSRSPLVVPVILPPPPILTSVKESRSQFICSMIERIKLHQAAEMVVFDAWFLEIPALLGVKVTLDSAACALLLQLMGKASNDQNMIRNSRELYAKSLDALQVALAHPREWRRSETLGAAMLLCIFEVGRRIYSGRGLD